MDTGVDGSGSELAGRVSSASMDASTSRNTPVGTDFHATEVAGVIAANFDGNGIVGVAYNSTILSVRVDDPTPQLRRWFDLPQRQLGRHRHRLRHRPRGEGGEHVVRRAGRPHGSDVRGGSPARRQRRADLFDRGRPTTATANANWPSGYGVDPRYAGSIIIAGASTRTGALATFSNTGGAAGGAFLLAPGDHIVTGLQQCRSLPDRIGHVLRRPRHRRRHGPAAAGPSPT
ncbi:MAG: S8 family serine peptidase [Caulobacteraceae bacterium]